jgi:predicted DNA-binding WGR domain protein
MYGKSQPVQEGSLQEASLNMTKKQAQYLLAVASLAAEHPQADSRMTSILTSLAISDKDVTKLKEGLKAISGIEESINSVEPVKPVKPVSSVNEEMAYLEPSRKHFAGIVETMRKQLDVTGIPKWFRFLVFQEGSSNKYHYFAIFAKGNGFVAANAYGRIGYGPKVVQIAEGNDYGDVEQKALAKYRVKSSKGYSDITDLLKK